MRRVVPILIALGLAVAATPAVADEPDAEEVEEAEDVEAEESEEVADEEATEDEDGDDEDGDDEVAEDDDIQEVDEDPFADDEGDEPESAADDDEVYADHPTLAVSPNIGLTAPQLFGELGSWPIFGLGLGYILPFDIGSFERPIQLGLDATYTRPGATGEGHHSMLGTEGADYSWELDQQMLGLQLTTMFRFGNPGQGLTFNALIGPRLYLMESVMQAEGNDGQDFGENRETNTEVGVIVGGGAEYELGPGSLAGTIQFGGGPLEQRITGEANTGSVYLDVGYRLFF